MAWVARRALLLLAIGSVQFAAFEAALRTWGHSEAAPSFQALFMPDGQIGYRLRPNARTRFVTSEFDTHLAINAEGVRDDRDIGPKPANERRIVVLGDSLVLSVQVDQQQTFCSLLEARLNRDGGPYTYRVINAGVQGYGPVEELLFFREIARRFQPDLVIAAIFVGNDAEEAVASAPRLRAGGRPAVDVAADSFRHPDATTGPSQHGVAGPSVTDRVRAGSASKLEGTSGATASELCGASGAQDRGRAAHLSRLCRRDRE